MMDEKIKKLFNAIEDGIYVTDGKGVTQFVNKAYEKISGIPLEEISGRSMSRLIHQGYFKESASLRAIQEKSSVSIVESFSKEGRCLASAYPLLDEKGEVSLVVSIVRPMDSLNEMVHRIRESEELNRHYAEELAKLWASVHCDELIVGQNKPMQRVLEKIDQVAGVDTTVLLTGETGVGKEIIAREIHRRSARANRSFIKVNCAAIPDALFESELFGYEKGAFTGALEGGKPGMFEMAHNGTVLLDEIGELSLASQSKLLRVLQDQRVQRLGSTKVIQLNLRVLAATNKDLLRMTQEGTFRKDLFYRLSVIPIRIPPLRERGQDILLFAKKYLDEFNLKYDLNKEMSLEAAKELLYYPWPGNVREMKNFMERVILTSPQQRITREQISRQLEDPDSGTPQLFVHSGSYNEALEEVERYFIHKALQNNETTRQAALELGISQSTFVRKTQKYKLKKE